MTNLENLMHFMTYCIIFIIFQFFQLFNNFIFKCSYNMFLINHTQIFKYLPQWDKGKVTAQSLSQNI